MRILNELPAALTEAGATRVAEVVGTLDTEQPAASPLAAKTH
jgi:hypothetical protein